MAWSIIVRSRWYWMQSEARGNPSSSGLAGKALCVSVSCGGIAWYNFIMAVNLSQNKTYSGSFSLCCARAGTKKAEKSFFSLPVENMPYYCPVSRIKADLNLAERPSKAHESCLLSLRILPHPGPGKAAGMRIWRSFFPTVVSKKGIFRIFRYNLAFS